MSTPSADDTKCFICTRNFTLFRPAHRCKRCAKKVCEACSINNRYIPRQSRMRRVCDVCLECEHEVTFNHRPRIDLQHDPETRSSLIINADPNSEEYATGLVNNCNIIAVNNQNVELWITDMIADKLNNVTLPFSMVLDYTKAEIDYDTLQKLKLKSIENHCLGLGRYVFMWQYLENDAKWKDISHNVAHRIQKLPIAQLEQHTLQYTYTESRDIEWKYTVLKQNDDEGIQTNVDTRNQRDIRRILFDTHNNKRIVWQYKNDHNELEWRDIYDCQQMLGYSRMKHGEISRYTNAIGHYELQRIDDNNATQTNTITNTRRVLRMITKDKSEIDETFRARVNSEKRHIQSDKTFKRKRSRRSQSYTATGTQQQVHSNSSCSNSSYNKGSPKLRRNQRSPRMRKRYGANTFAKATTLLRKIKDTNHKVYKRPKNDSSDTEEREKRKKDKFVAQKLRLEKWKSLNEEKEEKLESQTELQQRKSICVGCNKNINNVTQSERNDIDDNEVALWLRDKLKMPQYVEMFIQHGYDEMNTVIHTLSLDVLSQIGMKKMGHRDKLMMEVKKMKDCNQRVTSENTQVFGDDKHVESEQKLKLEGNERILFIELAKKLENDIDNYQTDYVQRNKSGKLKAIKIFAAKEAQVIRDWNTFKKGSFENLVEIYEDQYDDDDVDEELYDVLVYKPLFDIIVTCYDVLKKLYTQIKHEYVYGRSYHLILMNIQLFYYHVIKSKSEMKKKRFANISTYLQQNVFHEIHIKMEKKHKEHDANCSDINKFIVKCCSVLWDIIGYEYSLYPLLFEFEHNQTYDVSVHERHGVEKGDMLRYCVFPAMHKDSSYYSKIWTLCKDDNNNNEDVTENINNTNIKQMKPKSAQESCWDYPLPPKVDHCRFEVKIVFNEVLIAITKQAMRVLETSHRTVYYIPPQDVDMQYLLAINGNNSAAVCEFKGVASYYNVSVNDKVVQKGAWSYVKPGDEAQGIKDHIAFYARDCECYVNDERVVPQQGWITCHVARPFNGGSGTKQW